MGSRLVSGTATDAPCQNFLAARAGFQASSTAAFRPIMQSDVLALHGYIYDTLAALTSSDPGSSRASDQTEANASNTLIHRCLIVCTFGRVNSDIEIYNYLFQGMTLKAVGSNMLVEPLTRSLRVTWQTSENDIADFRRVVDWEAFARDCSTQKALTCERQLDVDLRTLLLWLADRFRQEQDSQSIPCRRRKALPVVVFDWLGLGKIALLDPLLISLVLLLNLVSLLCFGVRRDFYSSDAADLVNESFTTGRKLARTRRAHLALVPAMAEVGGNVVVLAGGRVPLVVRREDDQHWLFVGDTYINGIMEGEAFEEELYTEMRFK